MVWVEANSGEHAASILCQLPLMDGNYIYIIHTHTRTHTGTYIHVPTLYTHVYAYVCAHAHTHVCYLLYTLRWQATQPFIVLITP